MMRAGNLAAEAAAGVLADEHDVSSASMPTQRATSATVCTVLCVEPCRYSLPFCQYAIAVRVSSG